jgi:hypothetical protein
MANIIDRRPRYHAIAQDLRRMGNSMTVESSYQQLVRRQILLFNPDLPTTLRGIGWRNARRLEREAWAANGIHHGCIDSNGVFQITPSQQALNNFWTHLWVRMRELMDRERNPPANSPDPTPQTRSLPHHLLYRL